MLDFHSDSILIRGSHLDSIRFDSYLKKQVDVLARELYFQGLLKNGVSGERDLSMDTANLHRILIDVCSA